MFSLSSFSDCLAGYDVADQENSSFDIEEGKHRQQEELSKSRNVVAIGMDFLSFIRLINVYLDTHLTSCFSRNEETH